MKKLISIAVVFLMFLVGCSNQENNITNPISAETEHYAAPIRTEFQLTTANEEFTNLVKTTKVIDGAVGGRIFFEQVALNREGKLIYTYAEFEISAGAFEGTETITMLVDVDNGCISFFPHLNFSKICYLNYQLKYMNLDYIGFTKSDKKASFVYFNDSGTIDPVLNMGVTLNYQNGSLRVQSAEITHFSRYGFIRKED